MFLLSESLSVITSLCDLSRYIDRSLGSAKVSVKVLSHKVKSPSVFAVIMSKHVLGCMVTVLFVACWSIEWWGSGHDVVAVSL